MLLSRFLLYSFLVGQAVNGFVSPHVQKRTLSMALSAYSDEDIMKDLGYKPGQANTEFARRFAPLAEKPIKTVGEAFAEFSQELGFTVNPLYKNLVTDLVATTHLIVVNVRFQRDPVWSLGLLTSLELLLKNYPEPEIAERIIKSLFKAVEVDEQEARAEADTLMKWSEGKSLADLEAAMSGEGDSVLAQVAKKAKDDKYWKYSRFFGLGLVKLMENAGVEMDKDEVYPVMEDFMTNKLGKSHISACADSDMFFKVKEKLDMMETLMKEIEIREKKRMAERLEKKAEEALKAAENAAKAEVVEAAEAVVEP